MFIFCRNAFLSASKRFVEKDLEVTVAGRAFMITGANSGIGKATAMAIAKKGTRHTACLQVNFSVRFCFPQEVESESVVFVSGGTVHMVCRNKDKAEEARADIVKESGNKVGNESHLIEHLK